MKQIIKPWIADNNEEMIKAVRDHAEWIVDHDSLENNYGDRFQELADNAYPEEGESDNYEYYLEEAYSEGDWVVERAIEEYNDQIGGPYFKLMRENLLTDLKEAIDENCRDTNGVTNIEIDGDQLIIDLDKPLTNEEIENLWYGKIEFKRYDDFEVHDEEVRIGSIDVDLEMKEIIEKTIGETGLDFKFETTIED